MSSSDCYPDKAPKVDELLDALEHRLRREIVHYFENHAEGRTATLDDLTAHVGDRVPSGRGDLTTEFVHVHLPKLRDLGWVDYDSQDWRVRYHGHEQAEQLLAELRDVFA